jgi:hypothetical protein
MACGYKCCIKIDNRYEGICGLGDGREYGKGGRCDPYDEKGGRIDLYAKSKLQSTPKYIL